jgi:hypothetical protein
VMKIAQNASVGDHEAFAKPRLLLHNLRNSAPLNKTFIPSAFSA